MAYGLKYRNNFEGINDLTNVKYNVLLEIFQEGYVGAVTEIEEMDKNPLQFRLDNSGDAHYVPIKKTSVSINIVDTGQFDYSEFYTSNAKMYKVVITSPVLNWKGYLVPQSYNSNLNYRQPFTLTASDGLHLLSSIDYVPDQSKTVSLSTFIADVESKIGLGTFDKTTTIQTEIGNVWDALIYEGMFTDLNYEEALEMALKSIGMQLRYWKIFPIIESYNVTNNADVQIINKDITLDFLAPIKTAKVTQNITTLPDLMLNGMVDDLSDLAESNVGHVLPFDTLSKWVADPTVGGIIVNRGRTRSTSDRDTSDYFTSINLELMPVNGVKESFELTGNEISYFVCRPVYATPLTFSIKANFGKIAYFSGRGSASGLVNSKLYPAKYTELKYGIYDEISNKSFNYSTMAWDITGRPTQANCNKLRITDPKDGDTTIYIETPVTSGTTSKINLYLLGGSVEYVDAMLPAVAQTMVKNILSIDAIEVDGVSLVSDKELYNETSSVVDVAPNIDVLDYEVDFGYCPSPPANTSLYYGSAFYHTNLAQILNVVVQGNTIPWLQYIYQTLLYTQNVQRKKVYTCSLLLKSVVNPIWLRTTLMGDVVVTNSLNFDWKTSQISAELTEIQPYVYSAWNITSESKIGSSDWGGSGGTSGSVGGGGGSVDLSNYVVKTGAASQDIEGDISANNMVSRGAVVAGALNGTLPDDLPVSSPLLYGVSKYDDVTIKINANGQWYVATSGGTVVSFGTEVPNQSIQLIVAAITKTLALAGHTHSQYLLSTAYTASDVLTKLLTVDGADSGLDADLLDGLQSDFFRNRYSATIKKGVWSRILYATPIDLFGSFILTIQHTRDSVVVGNVFLVTFGHSGHGQITVLGTHGYTQIQARLTGDSNNIYFEIFDDGGGTLGDVQITTITLDSINANITPYTSFTDGSVLSGIEKSIVSTVYNRINVDGSTVAFLTDNVASATKLSSVRTFELTGDVEGSITSDLASGVSISTTIAPNSVALGTDTTGNYLASIGVSGNGLSKTGTEGEGATLTVVSNATAANSINTIMYRDATGSYMATNGIHTGAVVAGGLNGTLPDDLPVATSSLYGVVKFDPTTLALNGSNQLTVIGGGGGSDVAWGTPTAQYTPLTVDSVTRNLSLDGHTHSYLPLTGGNLTGGLTINSNTIWHAGNDGSGSGLDADLLRGVAPSNLAVLSATKLQTTRTIWGQNFNGEANVTGAFSGATTGSFSSTVSATTGIFSNLTANYIPKHTAGGLANSIIYDNGTTVTLGNTNSYTRFSIVQNVDSVIGGFGIYSSDLNGSVIYREVGAGNLILRNTGINTLFIGSGKVGILGSPSYTLDVNGTFRSVGAAYLNSTLAVTGTSTFTGLLTANGVTAANVVSSGSVVAGALNGTLPADLPVATTSLFGVSKYSGLAVQPTAGDVALRTKHYTSPTANTWYNKAYTITYEVGFSSPGSLSAGAYYSSLYLYALPTAKCLACNITVIPYATGTTPPWIGQQLIASAAKDSTGYWRVFIYNPTSSSVDLTNVKLSIIAQMIE